MSKDELECVFVANNDKGTAVVWVTDEETLTLMAQFRELGDDKAVSLVFHVARAYGRVIPATNGILLRSPTITYSA